MRANEVPITKTDAVGDIRKVNIDLAKYETDKVLSQGAPLVWTYGKVIGHVYYPA